MSLSKERQDYHLTPRGWKEDSVGRDIGRKHPKLQETKPFVQWRKDNKDVLLGG